MSDLDDMVRGYEDATVPWPFSIRREPDELRRGEDTKGAKSDGPEEQRNGEAGACERVEG